MAPKVFVLKCGSSLSLKGEFWLHMLWFKCILGLMFFELVSIIFAIVPDYGNEYTTKENKNWTSFKNFALKLNLNHNTYNKMRPQKIPVGNFLVFYLWKFELVVTKNLKSEKKVFLI